MPIPTLWTMKAEIDFVGGFHQLVGQARSAAGTENNTVIAKGRENLVIPPARVPELDHVPARGIQLLHDPAQSRRGILKAGWELKQKAAHSRSEQVGNMTEVTH